MTQKTNTATHAPAESVTVPFAEAVKMLPAKRAKKGDRETIHVFIVGRIGIPIGGDWDRKQAIALLRYADEIFVTDGDMARMLAEQHVERNLRRLTALRLAMAHG